MNQPGLGRVQFASRWLAAEDEAGRRYGRELLALPTGKWRSEMSSDPNLRRYGTLRFLLGEIHNELYQGPLQARERAAVVIEYADGVDIPSAHYRAYLSGLAWREYANALKLSGEFGAARDAAQRSRAIFEDVGSLASDAAKAHLVEALILRELGDLDAVLKIATACERVFLEYEESAAFMQARMTRALVLSDTGRYDDAMAILAETAADAEKRGDRRTVAICLHNSAECARALGDRVTARKLDARALALFEELGTTIEKPSIRGTEALALADEGKISLAIFQLRITRSEFLALGMNGSAADCGLAIVRLRFDRGEDVTAECVELIETLTRAGMVQPAIEALAYLREQSHGNSMSAEKIEYVREFVREAVRGPVRTFLPPSAEDRA